MYDCCTSSVHMMTLHLQCYFVHPLTPPYHTHTPHPHTTLTYTQYLSGDEEEDDEEGQASQRRKAKQKKAKKKTSIYDVYEPSELERGFFTERDNDIRVTDMPERFLVSLHCACKNATDYHFICRPLHSTRKK